MIVRVNPAEPTATLDGDSPLVELIDGVPAAVTLKITELEVAVAPLFAPGLLTSIKKLPTALKFDAGITAVKVLALFTLVSKDVGAELPELHWTTEPLIKLVPVIVIWSAALPTTALVELMVEIVGAALAVTVNGYKLDTDPPGFVTVTNAVTTLAANVWVTIADNCVALM